MGHAADHFAVSSALALEVSASVLIGSLKM
jgi:hypothetical protein